MLYLLTILVLAILPLLAGWRQGASCSPTTRPTRRLLVTTALAPLVWWFLAISARHYSELDAPGWMLAEWFAQRGKWYLFTGAGLWGTGLALRQQHALNERRRLLMALALELLFVLVLVWKTVPVHVGIKHSNRRDNVGHILQSIEPTCGPVALANLLEQYYGRTNITERHLARLTHTTVEGSTVGGLRRAAQRQGLQVTHCNHWTFEQMQKHGGPAIVSISTMPEVKHATLLCGFVGAKIAFLDPNYGYREISHDRFKRIWYGKTLTFEPPLKRTTRPGSVAVPLPKNMQPPAIQVR